MRVVKSIPISNIFVDSWHISPKAYGFAKEMERGSVFPPIKVYQDKVGKYIIKDGRNRITAFKLIGKQFINCQLYQQSIWKQ